MQSNGTVTDVRFSGLETYIAQQPVLQVKLSETIASILKPDLDVGSNLYLIMNAMSEIVAWESNIQQPNLSAANVTVKELEDKIKEIYEITGKQTLINQSLKQKLNAIIEAREERKFRNAEKIFDEIFNTLVANPQSQQETLNDCINKFRDNSFKLFFGDEFSLARDIEVTQDILRDKVIRLFTFITFKRAESGISDQNCNRVLRANLDKILTQIETLYKSKATQHAKQTVEVISAKQEESLIHSKVSRNDLNVGDNNLIAGQEQKASLMNSREVNNVSYYEGGSQNSHQDNNSNDSQILRATPKSKVQTIVEIMARNLDDFGKFRAITEILNIDYLNISKDDLRNAFVNVGTKVDASIIAAIPQLIEARDEALQKILNDIRNDNLSLDDLSYFLRTPNMSIVTSNDLKRRIDAIAAIVSYKDNTRLIHEKIDALIEKSKIEPILNKIKTILDAIASQNHKELIQLLKDTTIMDSFEIKPLPNDYVRPDPTTQTSRHLAFFATGNAKTEDAQKIRDILENKLLEIAKFARNKHIKDDIIAPIYTLIRELQFVYLYTDLARQLSTKAWYESVDIKDVQEDLQNLLVMQLESRDVESEQARVFAAALLNRDDFMSVKRDKILFALKGVGISFGIAIVVPSLLVVIEGFVSLPFLAPIAPVITALTTSIAAITSPALAVPIILLLAAVGCMLIIYSACKESKRGLNTQEEIKSALETCQTEIAKLTFDGTSRTVKCDGVAITAEDFAEQVTDKMTQAIADVRLNQKIKIDNELGELQKDIIKSQKDENVGTNLNKSFTAPKQESLIARQQIERCKSFVETENSRSLLQGDLPKSLT